MKTIAPILTKHLESGGTLTPLEGLEEARRELQELKSLVRAVKFHLSETHYPDGGSREPSTARLWRAYNRIDRG